MLGCLVFVKHVWSFITLTKTNTSLRMTVMYGNMMYGGILKRNSSYSDVFMHAYFIYVISCQSLSHVTNYP